MVQLQLAIEAVFGSWNNPRAVLYRQQEQDRRRSGHRRQRAVHGVRQQGRHLRPRAWPSPATPPPARREFYGDYLVNAQGEDVVAGIRNTRAHRRSEDRQRALDEADDAAARRSATRWKTTTATCATSSSPSSSGKLWMLQTRVGKRTAAAALAHRHRDLEKEGLITTRRGHRAAWTPTSSTSCCTRSSTRRPTYDVRRPRPGRLPGRRRAARSSSPPPTPSPPPRQAVKCVLVRRETNPDDLRRHDRRRGHPHLPAAARPRTRRSSPAAWARPACVVRRSEAAAAASTPPDADEPSPSHGTDRRDHPRRGPTLTRPSTGYHRGIVVASPPPAGAGHAASSTRRRRTPSCPSGPTRSARLGVRANADNPEDAQLLPRVRCRGHRPVPHRAHVPGRAHARSSRRVISDRRRDPLSVRPSFDVLEKLQKRRLPGDARGHGRQVDDRAPASTRRCTSSCPALIELARPRSPSAKATGTARPRRRGHARRGSPLSHEQNPMLGLRGVRLGIYTARPVRPADARPVRGGLR